MNKKDTSNIQKEKSKRNIKVITRTKNKSSLNNKKALILYFIIILFFFVFLFNPTFFKTSYKRDKVDFDIPLFMYFLNDENGIITFKTWRKYDYIENYFDNYLTNSANFSFYDCKMGKTLYYNEKNNFVIDKIEIKKKALLKEINIHYEILNASEVCK